MLFNDMIIIGGVLLKNPRSVPAGQSRIGGKANVDLASSTASSCLTSETCTVFPFESFQVLANSESKWEEAWRV